MVEKRGTVCIDNALNIMLKKSGKAITATAAVAYARRPNYTVGDKKPSIPMQREQFFCHFQICGCGCGSGSLSDSDPDPVGFGYATLAPKISGWERFVQILFRLGSGSGSGP
jgi:hypothetical protein